MFYALSASKHYLKKRMALGIEMDSICSSQHFCSCVMHTHVGCVPCIHVLAVCHPSCVLSLCRLSDIEVFSNIKPKHTTFVLRNISIGFQVINNKLFKMAILNFPEETKVKFKKLYFLLFCTI